MTVVTEKHVAKAFSSTVTDFISKGYIISPFTPDGSFNNTKTYIDLFNPNDNSHIIRVWMVDEYNRVGKSWLRHIDTVGVRAKKYTIGRYNGYNGNIGEGQYLLPSSGELVYENLFYKFKTRKSHNGTQYYNVYATSYEEAVALSEISYKRINESPTKNDNGYRRVPLAKLSPKFIDLIMDRINSVRGFKRATSTCITLVEMYKGYQGKLIAKVSYEFNSKRDTITLN